METLFREMKAMEIHVAEKKKKLDKNRIFNNSTEGNEAVHIHTESAYNLIKLCDSMGFFIKNFLHTPYNTDPLTSQKYTREAFLVRAQCLLHFLNYLIESYLEFKAVATGEEEQLEENQRSPRSETDKNPEFASVAYRILYCLGQLQVSCHSKFRDIPKTSKEELAFGTFWLGGQ